MIYEREVFLKRVSLVILKFLLGLLVSLDGYPLAYCIHGGQQIRGSYHVTDDRELLKKYELDDFVVVADSGYK
jgi:hypothetical protein